MSDCLFCKFSETSTSLCFEDEQVIVVNDITPQAPIHQLIIPRKHIATLNDVTEQENGLIGHMIYIAKEQAKKHGIDQTGFRAVFNCNEEGGQAIYHIHLHLLGGRSLKWPPG